jgi:hypothetical protein
MQTVSLPYIDNAKAILITLAINVGVLFLFYWPNGISYSGIMWDSLFCAVITTIVSMWIVYPTLKKMRALGGMPAQVPESNFMQKLPTNPIVLGVVYTIGFIVLTVGINAVILWFFDVENMAFVPWALYKLVYTTVLSAKIVEFCIFRYVQPDWANTLHSSDIETGEESLVKPVKNPLPKISVFTEMFGSVTVNIAMNIIIGSLLGGVKVGTDGSVIILATTVEGIPITGLVFGLLTGFLVTNGIMKEIDTTILASGPEILKSAETNKRFTWMPKGGVALTCFICICVMLFSAVALWGFMVLFGISIMNFYQFTIFITVYATLISKPLSYLLVRRCMQSDYIQYTLNKAKTTE